MIMSSFKIVDNVFYHLKRYTVPAKREMWCAACLKEVSYTPTKRFVKQLECTTFDDADNPIYTDCCLLREDAREPCPLKCFAAVNSGDSMKSAILRMRSNSDCWTSETAPDEGYLKV
jgi:hypothetical protein